MTEKKKQSKRMVNLVFDKLTDEQVAELRRIFLSLPPDVSFVHGPGLKRIHDPRRARPI